MKRKNSTVMDGLDYIDPDIRSLARPIGDLNPDPANARKHPDRNLEAIKSSLARFGQKKPLVAHVDVAVQRWCEFTGKDATRESDGAKWSELSGKSALSPAKKSK